MTITEGFELIREEELPELNSKGMFYRHVQTGAELLSIVNDDENKVFGITFRTPPRDSTGAPHIIEHSVLGGSRKYPVKEPFVQLMKGSLNTFLNAMTYSDKTTYPVASQNLKDFYNLVDVYLDAVFYPTLSANTFKQEGWHFELDAAEQPLNYKGIVFNEMKGALSSPEAVLEDYVQQTLFPDTPYHFNSGGDPAVIPDLSYEGFKQFHATYYHPSNARIFFYGDDDPAKRLKLLNAYLGQFQRLEISSSIPLQPKFAEPKSITVPYEVSGEESPSKYLVGMAWALAEAQDAELRFALAILHHILIGTPASPLRKALIESGLGEDLVGSGLTDDVRQITFLTGMKGVEKDNVEKVEALIANTLIKLATQGIDGDTVAAAVNTVEFSLRENNTGHFPRGLAVMLRSLATWLYNGSPFVDLHINEPLEAIKRKLDAGEHYFEYLIADTMINNPHQLVVVLEPDPGLARRRAEAEQARLDKEKASFSQAALEQIVSDTRLLKQLQETPDSPEALATIPHLSLADLDKTPRIIPKETLSFSGAPVLYHDLFTNGILYLDVGLNLHTLPQEWLPYVSLFGRALTEMGAEGEDYVHLLQRIGRDTGGIYDQTYVSQGLNRETSEAWLFVRGKCMASKIQLMLSLFRDILVNGTLDNRERFKQIVLEEKASVESSLVDAGHRYANSRLLSSMNEAGAVNEKISGISYLFFLRDLVDLIEKDWQQVADRLLAIRSHLVNRRNMIVNITLDRASFNENKVRIEEFIKLFPGEAVRSEAWLFDQPPTSEGLTIPSQVNFVAKGGNLFNAGYQLKGSSLAIMQYLNTTWLWDKVRVQGGAYGGFAVFEQYSGAFSYLSYRDPNLVSTVQAYDQTPEFLRQGHLDAEELEKSIIGAVGELDTYQLPDAKGFSSLARHLLGITDKWRQQFRDELLSTTEKDFVQMAQALDEVTKKGHTVVIGPVDAIQKANEKRPGWLAIKKVL